MEISPHLFAPESYLRALPEVVAKIVNGCGPGGGKLIWCRIRSCS